MAFDGSDRYTRVFATASQVKRLNSFSLVGLYFQGKDKFLESVGGLLPEAGALPGPRHHWPEAHRSRPPRRCPKRLCGCLRC
jgi:hypothetical protein